MDVGGSLISMSLILDYVLLTRILLSTSSLMCARGAFVLERA
jgi:hypothetical protein